MGVSAFFSEKLQIPEEVRNGLGPITTRKVLSASRSRIHGEGIVIFSDKLDRDKIASFAKNLAEWTDEGRATAGLRLFYPEHLAKDFRALERYGAYLRKTRGQGMRRNYCFLDDTESIYMDVCLPGEEDWIRITTEMAQEANNKRQNTVDREARRRIALTSPTGRNRQPNLTGANATVVGTLTNSLTTTSTDHQTDEFRVSGR